jgi:2-dehydro-3-deoxyphosphogluconate aldolase/(4S)-4-hydroxy-2-oxoglutarate aldolase
MKQIIETGIVPITIIDNTDDAVPTAQALKAGGISIIEVAFRTDAAEQAVHNIVREMPEMLVGAGTVLSKGQIDAAVNAGAQFGVSPGLNESLVNYAREKNLPFFPGVITASEIERALSLGCEMLKFFPAEPAGGIKLLKALSAPYLHTGVKFIPLGGVNASNMAAYLSLPSVAAIGGSWIAERKLIAGKNWQEITRRTQEAVRLADGRLFRCARADRNFR